MYLLKRLLSTSKLKPADYPKFKKIDILIGTQQSQFHGIWLRDHCKCPQCYHAVTKQRLLDTHSIPLDISPISVKQDTEKVKITWQDGHESEYDLDWLRANSYSPPQPQPRKEINLWGASLIQQLPSTDYKDIMNSKEGLKEWLVNIDKFGIAFVDNVPADVEHSSLLARRISFFRETHYGKFWDFTSDFAHGDTAYSTLALPAHTDTTYFSEPVGLQFFHLLEHRGTGGKSLYVDGFNAALQLQKNQEWAFEALTNIHISAHASGDKEFPLEPSPKTFPIIRIDPDTGHIYQIKSNNDDRSTLNLSSNQTELFYAALHEWNKLLRYKENELWIQLKPGKAVIMDNWRVLHGRSAFTGYRRMVGCYIGYDDFKSRLQSLSRI